jgi:Uma2 family endonuclease
MLLPMLDVEDIRPGTIRSIRRLEYDRLVAMGLFVGENLELLRGQLVTMSPEGWLHSELVAWFNEYLIRSLDPSFSVRPGLPFAVSDDSEPQPDIFVGRKEPGRREHPSSTLLLIEVSDSSIRKDRKIKHALYAEAGVPEYWIVDITDDDELVVEVYTEPRPTGYAKLQRLRSGDVLRPLHLPVTIAIADLPR